MSVTVRKEEISDILSIRKVVEQAFPSPAEADLVDHLRKEEYGIYSLVAVDDDNIIGHAMFSLMKAPFKALGLAPVAILPGRQKCGVGSHLIREGLKLAEQDGWEGVFVLGDPDYYRRFGFRVEETRGFQSPYAGPHFMLKDFKGIIQGQKGTVDYAPPFNNLT